MLADGFPAPHFYSTGAIGSLTISRTNQCIVDDDILNRIRQAIATARKRDDGLPEAIINRAEEILEKTEAEIRSKHEAVYSLLRDWGNGVITLDELADQWYQFDKTGLVAADKDPERERLAYQWSHMDKCRRPIHDLISPSYILDRNYHFLDWNPMFDELIAKPMRLTRFRHAEDFILKLKNHRQVIERSKQKFSDDGSPVLDIEDLEFESPKYGLIVFKKIAAQIPSDKGGLLAWSVNLNITHAERAGEMWVDLERRMSAEVNWSIYAKLYDRMLLQFDPYVDLINKSVELLGNARVVGDFGAGTGNITTKLLEQSLDRKVWALEANEGMLVQMRRKLQNLPGTLSDRIKVCKGDLMVSLRECEQDSFDGAIMVNTLYAISDRSRCLREIYRVLKPGGTLVYSTSTNETDIERLFQSIEKHLDKKGALKGLRQVVDLAYERHRAMLVDIVRDTSEAVVDYARKAGFDVANDDVWRHEYEGAVTIVRAIKPKYHGQETYDRIEGPPLSETPTGEMNSEKETGSDDRAISLSNGTPHIFISYAREDKDWCEQIICYLKPAELAEKVKIWADTEIQYGEKWEKAIASNLERASVGILLITPEFLASEYIRTKEMPWLLDKMDAQQITIIPIMIKKALVEHAHFKYPDPKIGPKEIILSDLQIEMHQDHAIDHLDKPTQNVFIGKLAQNILKKITKFT